MNQSLGEMPKTSDPPILIKKEEMGLPLNNRRGKMTNFRRPHPLPDNHKLKIPFGIPRRFTPVLSLLRTKIYSNGLSARRFYQAVYIRPLNIGITYYQKRLALISSLQFNRHVSPSLNSLILYLDAFLFLSFTIICIQQLGTLDSKFVIYGRVPLAFFNDQKCRACFPKNNVWK